MGVLLYVAAFSVVALFYYWKVIYDYICHRLYIMHHVGKITGPVALPIVGTAWQFKWKSDEVSMQIRDWGAYYANQGHSMVKLWLGPMPVVIIIRPEAAKVVLESNTVITKGIEYDILLPWLGTGLLTSTGFKWQTRRKMLTPSFHFKMLNDFLIVHDYESKIFLEQLEPFANSGKEFDIFPYLKRCALDIICETAMGCTVKAQTHHDDPYVRSVQKMNEMAFKFQQMPWLRLQFFQYITGFGKQYQFHLKTVLDFTRKVIDDKLAEPEGGEPGERKVFLDMLVELSREGELNHEDIREEVDTFMFEGHDTTSASMGWTLWYLAHYQDCQEKVLKELDQVFGDSDRDCTNEDLKQLKYLERCIKESLRLRPSVPLFSRKVEEDLDINGLIIPRGCSIAVAPIILQTNSTVYEDAQKFDPDRFTEENSQKRHPYAYIPFSAGPRNCIGQKFALMEEKTLLSWFFRKYKISSSIPCEKNLALPEVIMRPSLGFPVNIEKRM